MENADKINIKDLIQNLKTFFKDTYQADARKFRDEVHVKFPNGQKFYLDIFDISKEARDAKFEEMLERIFRGATDEEYNKKFEIALMNCIQLCIWAREGIEAEQKNNQIFVTLKTGQEYVVTIQRK